MKKTKIKFGDYWSPAHAMARKLMEIFSRIVKSVGNISVGQSVDCIR